MSNAQPAIEMYSTQACPFCQAARQYLDARGLVYQERRVDLEPGLRAEMMARGAGHTVPQIWIGETHVGGYTDMIALHRDGSIEALLAPS